mmetsp:Transcript_9222/g.13926  ORF Transcript_9222/g.13926 Transcript_9222/m.13926 type:complete len:290 (-) Transcript_9222:141-1010(-)
MKGELSMQEATLHKYGGSWRRGLELNGVVSASSYSSRQFNTSTPLPESNKRNMTMRRYSTDSSSFSGIDWSGMFGESSRRQQQQSHNLNADSIDIPSMDGEGGADVASSDGEDKKGLEEHFKQQKRLSVTFDLNEDSCHEDIMEHSRRIGAAKSATRSSSSWCLALFTLLAIVVGTVACFITFPPNTATLNWKKVMSGMSGNNNNVVQQQLLQQQQGRGQEMLELAEQITAACGGESSRSSTGTSSCQELCHNHMCCVEQDDEYSCKNDVAEDCGVYAGCVALIDDNLW